MSTTFNFDFATRDPDEHLSTLVESFWYARGKVPYRRERIAPTGSTVAVIVLGDPIVVTPNDGEGTPLRTDRGFLLGPHDRPVVNAPTGETYAVGVVTTPVGCESVFGIRPSRIRGAATVLGREWPAAESLRAALLECRGPEQMLDLLAQAVTDGMRERPPGLDRCVQAVAMLEEAPTRTVAEIAAELGVSHGHLDREFTRIVGMSPKSLSRLLRMRRVLSELDVRTDVGWAELAIEQGWFDQAHLIRDFKRHTGVTPSQYIAAQRAVFTPVDSGDAAGFVPEM